MNPTRIVRRVENRAAEHTVWGALVAQRGFLTLVGVVGLLRFLVPPGRVPDARETWTTVLALWGLSVLWVAWGRSDHRPVGERVGDIGAHNLGIQGLIVLPSVIVGMLRLYRDAGALAATDAFPSNALVTVIFLPLASLVVFTFAALPCVWLLQKVLFLPAVAVLVGVLLPHPAAAQPCSGRPTTALGLDHVVVAVADLPRAVEWFSGTLGFTLKPGRLHDNGIENAHAKFVDGTEIELLTVSNAADDLARDYARFLVNGAGAAYLALRGIELDADAAGRLGGGASLAAGPAFRWISFPADHPLRHLFLFHLVRPVVDEPTILRHDNGAAGLAAVVISGSDVAPERQFLRQLGAPVCDDAPAISSRRERARLANGEVVLVEGVERPRDRRITGIVVAVIDLDATVAGMPPGVLGQAVVDARGRGVRVISPEWIDVQIEFLEVGR